MKKIELIRKMLCNDNFYKKYQCRAFIFGIECGILIKYYDLTR